MTIDNPDPRRFELHRNTDGDKEVYSFTVEGTVEKADQTEDSFARANEADTVTEQDDGTTHVTGSAIRTGADAYTVEGDFKGISLDPQYWTLYIDGSEVSRSTLRGEADSGSDTGSGGDDSENSGSGGEGDTTSPTPTGTGRWAGAVETTADGDQKTVTLAHGLGQVPSAVALTPRTVAASSDWCVTDETASSVTVTYSRAPPADADLKYFLTVWG